MKNNNFALGILFNKFSIMHVAQLTSDYYFKYDSYRFLTSGFGYIDQNMHKYENSIIIFDIEHYDMNNLCVYLTSKEVE